MSTLRRLLSDRPAMPMSTAWYLTLLAEAKGRQELFTRQSPQRLQALREYALIESAVASNRIEGVEIDPSRVRAVVLGRPVLRDRNEEEVAGYRDALQLIHTNAAGLDISEATILELHRLSRGESGDAGQYKEKDVDIIESYPDGRSRVRFRTVPATATPSAVRDLVTDLGRTGTFPVPPLVAVAAFNLDFLCVHPFRDGNGRVSRLLLLLQCYHAGIEVGRYVSIERTIELHKERYYETLEESSQRWHEGQHDPWPYVNFLLFVLHESYREFERRAGDMSAPRGEKTATVLAAVEAAKGAFSIGELQRICPGVSVELIRRVLTGLKRQGKISPTGRGPAARWEKVKQ
jgi:Fic family protein